MHAPHPVNHRIQKMSASSGKRPRKKLSAPKANSPVMTATFHLLSIPAPLVR